ncbi:uncharacterized protein PgNI_04370, partial [Pyricularia grisea]|uniref:Uncharacterized protein n=1 Tax=Pyricularia grisea TaxID=148305 RepID=A0A6P8B938_PYRGI
KNKKIGRHCLPGLSGATAPVVPVWHDGHLIAELVAFDVDGPVVAGNGEGSAAALLLISLGAALSERMCY